jgi:tetratricopeptide (TPR) repeat protein
MPDLGRCSSFRACKPILAGFVLGAMLSLQGVHAARSDSVQAARYHEDALARLARNDVPGAIIQARNAVQQDKSLLAAHVLLGKALLRDGQAAAAEAEFEVALNLGASMTELAQPYGTALMMFGNSEKLLARIKPDGLGASARAEVLAMRAAAHADQGNMKAAWLAIDEESSRSPFACAFARRDRPGLAHPRHPSGAQGPGRRGGHGPRDAQLLHLQGVLNQGAGKVAAALDFFAQALKADPRLLDAMVARASLLIDLQRPDEAMPDLERAAALSQREPRVAYLKSLVFAARGMRVLPVPSSKK